jgi:hypothetical protein
LGLLVRLRFASRSPAMWRVCAFALSFVSGWRAFSSVSLCKSIYRDHGAGTIAVDQKDKADALAAELGVSGECKVVPMSPEVFKCCGGHNPESPWLTSCSTNGWLAVCCIWPNARGQILHCLLLLWQRNHRRLVPSTMLCCWTLCGT